MLPRRKSVCLLDAGPLKRSSCGGVGCLLARDALGCWTVDAPGIAFEIITRQGKRPRTRSAADLVELADAAHPFEFMRSAQLFKQLRILIHRFQTLFAQIPGAGG